MLGVEQSNTSVSWGEQSILKLFRRVLPGVNPDLELHRALRSVGSEQVASLQGAVEGTLDGEPVTLAMLQDYAANSAEGWAMALASVRDLLAEGDLRADEVGGDFAAEASRLGETIAVVHDELRRALGGAELDPARAGRGLARAARPRRPPRCPSWPTSVEPIRAVYDRVAELTDPVPTQRVHGDLHLGQALRTPYGWLVIDFEGEPATPLRRPGAAGLGAARRRRHAALLRLRRVPPAVPVGAGERLERPRPQLAAGLAGQRVGRPATGPPSATATRSAAGSDPREQGALLRAFELDKAVYEALYETRSRPTWAAIPLTSIRRLTAEAASDAGVG